MCSGFQKLPNIKLLLAWGPTQTGTNVKSVETAPGTGSSYHLKIYIFYISLKHKRFFSSSQNFDFLHFIDERPRIKSS